MANEAPCPCNNCPRALTCRWACDKLSEWAEDKSFARVADEFIAAYNRAERQAHRQKNPIDKSTGRYQHLSVKK